MLEHSGHKRDQFFHVHAQNSDGSRSQNFNSTPETFKSRMQEVVKKEVIKLLDSGIIYPISDSEWVSPIQCVPKKSRITVVKNEHNELIPTRTVT